MDIHTSIVNSHGAAIMRDLMACGFSAAQAHACLHRGVEIILHAVESHGLTRLLSLWDAQQAPALRPFIDLKELATCLDNNMQLATEGLLILLPRIIEFLRSDRALSGSLCRKNYSREAY
jgi:NAD-dependent oxidoreductase involved in siderophore biosynthesis